MTLDITWEPSPNWSVRDRSIRYIVLHTTQGTNSLAWLTGTASQVSAHYLIQESTIYQLVSEDNAAWHAGIIVGTPTTPLYEGVQLADGSWSINPNDESIGIEMEGFAGSLLTDVTIRTCVALIQNIEARRGFLPLVSHSELSPGNRSDPGIENRKAVERGLGATIVTDDEFLEKYNRLVAPNIANDLNGMKSVETKVVVAARDAGELLRQAGEVLKKNNL